MVRSEQEEPEGCGGREEAGQETPAAEGVGQAQPSGSALS